jgi:radical SAM protein with 4Fe4S-binding SPASM domain
MREVYVKYNSFKNFINNKDFLIENIKNLVNSNFDYQSSNFSDYKKKVLLEFKKDFDEGKFLLNPNVISELATIDENRILDYLFHRYRYEVFPKKFILDNYPPCIQIEPTSICNYRCIFCYQTDEIFNKKSNGHMGSMSFDLFKKIIDEVEGKVEFITLASRGEPLMNKEIIKMLDYSKDKFLNLKINTNASVLTEEKSHAILRNNVKTLVISADSADEENYSKLRVNGNLKKILRNIEIFNNIKKKYYSKSKIITRVSGVKVNENQNIKKMEDFWKDLVDQVAFVNYVPWENVYVNKDTDINNPCSDLWRRTFVWFDGSVNPCDVDYKSILKVGNVNNSSLSTLWKSEIYEAMRYKHLNNQRKKINPCKKCNVI